MRTTTWVILGLGCLVSGCPGGSGGGGGGSMAQQGVPVPATAQAQSDACDAVEACGVDRSDCDLLFDVAILDADCATEIETTSCEDHTGTDAPHYVDVCFPSCNTKHDSCADNSTIVRCADGIDGTLRHIYVRCTDVCEQAGSSYSGECGSSYMGQESGTGGDVCWCL